MYDCVILDLLRIPWTNHLIYKQVDNFDPKQLKIAIWNGDVKLQNLKIKKEVCYCSAYISDMRWILISSLLLSLGFK